MIIDKLDTITVSRQTGSGNFSIMATVKDTVDGIDTYINEVNDTNTDLVIKNIHNVVTGRDVEFILFNGDIGETYSIVYNQWNVVLGEEFYRSILVDTVTLHETTKLYYFREDIEVDSYSIGEVDAMFALRDIEIGIIQDDIVQHTDSINDAFIQIHSNDDDIALLQTSHSDLGDVVGQHTTALTAIALQVTGNSGDIQALQDSSHTHANKANLDTINQGLGTADTAIFGKIGINSTPLAGRMMTILNSFPTMDTSDTKYFISLLMQGYPSMGSGVTNSGYSVGLAVETSLKYIAHIGHEARNYGVYVSHGTYTDCVGTLGISVGIYLDGYHNGSTITDHIGIYQVSSSGTTARNVLSGKTVVGSTINTPSAKLEIAGTDGALLLPRLTTTQRNLLTGTNGMVIFNTTDGKFQGYVNGWINLH